MTEPTTELISFDYEGQRVAFDPMARMWSLTEMYQAVEAPSNKDPYKWLRQQQTQELLTALTERETRRSNPSISVLIETREGRNGGTWAHWQIAAAYAHYLRPDFYLQWNEWAMERVTGRGQLDSSRLAAVEARLAALEGKRQRVQTTPPLDAGVRVVLRWIERHHVQTFTRREVWQCVRRSFAAIDDIQPPLERLVHMGCLRLVPTPCSGRGRKPTQGYEVLPQNEQ